MPNMLPPGSQLIYGQITQLLMNLCLGRHALPVRREGGKLRGHHQSLIRALDPARRLPEDIQYQGEALLRIAQTRGSLLSLWSDFQARKTGSGGP